jgi:hypothetical protein
MYVCMRIYVCLYIYVYTHTYIHTHTHKYKYTYMYIYVYIYIYICTYIHITHTHTHTRAREHRACIVPSIQRMHSSLMRVHIVHVHNIQHIHRGTNTYNMHSFQPSAHLHSSLRRSAASMFIVMLAHSSMSRMRATNTYIYVYMYIYMCVCVCM